MEIRLNGDRHELAEPVDVDALLSELGLDRGRVAVEVNRTILPRKNFGRVVLQDGDEVEIVTFVGGG